MRPSPSIVPLDRLGRDIYVVLEDFGARAGCSWRQTEEQADRETLLRDLISGQYAYPVRIVVFNAIEGWSRDATDALAERAADERLALSPALEAFVQANATRRLHVQLVGAHHPSCGAEQPRPAAQVPADSRQPIRRSSADILPDRPALSS
ncbi:hypothetical protein SAMN05216525_12939 [Bradyrhizobium sp. Gha]|nr:hypothetical protein SAMN05216525_12939 [Bradyrhizobium sp. Gha]